MQAKIIGVKFAGAALVAVLSIAAQAADYDTRWYVTPMAGGLIADKDRLAKDGWWGGLAVGAVASRHVNLELELSADDLEFDGTPPFAGAASKDGYRQAGGEFGALFFLNRDATFAPFLRIGVGALTTNVDITTPGAQAEKTGWSGSAGFGVLANLAERFALRFDARYRHDTNENEQLGEQYFGDYIAALGVQVGFGHAAAAPAAAAAPVAAAVAAPSDSDNDGVTDDLDKCPGTLAGVKVDTTGCELDSDGDGVTDDKDLCANTPAGVKVNTTGCPEKVVLKGVNFVTNSDKLTPESHAILDKVAAALITNSGVNVNIDGYTDNTGSAALNNSLSIQRAEAVKTYLVGKGVDAGRMTARGFGPENPIADNNTAEGRAENRRVELVPIE